MEESGPDDQQPDCGGGRLKVLTFYDEGGFKHKSLVRDGDTDPAIGIIQSPPDLRRLDWEGIVKNIHCELLDRELLTITDIQNRSNEFNQIIYSKIIKQIYKLYQEQEQTTQ